MDISNKIIKDIENTLSMSKKYKKKYLFSYSFKLNTRDVLTFINYKKNEKDLKFFWQSPSENISFFGIKAIWIKDFTSPNMDFNIKNDLKIETENSLLSVSDLNELENNNLPTIEKQEEKLEKIKKQRESLGSVNLRADEETKKYKDEIQKMEDDRADLYSAIVKLKTSIDELNQKGREKLLEAFTKVNRKFNEVYTKLFSGGNAKLELVDSDDPLEAGLEMFASPPGKRLQSITLLSGGEQALTALSLVFAVFLVNPSPICVLDEVDAPLDDANVTRFCGLLDELTKITKTRFIIITHHALTMSRMHRLYGVTMAEQGISQLVAVDLQKAEELVA